MSVTNGETLELWIGIVEFRSLPGSVILGESKGALTNVVTWAASREEFGEKAARLAAHYLLFVNDIKDEEPVRLRRERYVLVESLEELVSSAEQNPDAILFGTLHKYRADTA